MKPLPAVLGVLALAAYPLLAHTAALTASGGVALLACMLLLVLVLLPGLRRGSLAALLALAAGIAALAWLLRQDLAMLPLYAPPVLLNGFVAWLFGRSLRAGRVPLIERVVRVLHGGVEQVDPAIAAYARRVTLAWTLMLGTLALLNLLLALLAAPGGLLLAAGITPPVTVPRSLWSLFANLLNYVLLALLFVLEYLWRRRRFPQQRYDGIADFGARLARLGPGFWRGG